MNTLSRSGNRGTRRRRLELIKRHGALSAGELAQKLAMTSMGVRQHLTALERDGLLTLTSQQRGVGRLRHVYALTAEADELFPRAYADMANALLSAVSELDGEAGVDRLLATRNRELAAQYRARMTERSFAERVQELVRIRTEEGYMADWEQLDDGRFLLREHSCAICQIAEQCPQACGYELTLSQQVFNDAHVRRQTHMIRGDATCTYVVEWGRA